MKKILVIHPALVMGGAETVLLNILNMLGENPNYHVEVLFLENRENYNFHLIPKHFKIDYALTGLESAFLLYIQSVFHQQNYVNQSEGYYRSWHKGIHNKIKDTIKEKIEQSKFDVIIDFQRNYTAFDDYFYDYDLPNETKAIRWLHGVHEIERWNSAPDYFGKLLPKYEKIVLICEEMLEKAKNVLYKRGITSENLTYLFNPQDQSDIRKKMEEVLSDEDEKLMTYDYFVQVSRLEEHQKNHLQLLEIYQKLKQKGIKEKLYIIGEGWQNHLKEKIKQLGLENDCFLLGRRNNPFPFMKNAKLFLHTAKWEGFGMVLTESMICGTPVVAFGCPTGPSEILGYGKYGVVIPPNDEDRFVEETFNLLNNPQQIETFKQLLPEANERFSNTTLSKSLYEMIDSIKGKSPSIDDFKW